MATSVILLDSRPEYLASEPATSSLLLLPLGTGTVYDYLREQVSASEAHALAVLPTFERAGEYQQAIQALEPEIGVLSAERFDRFLATQEPSDWMLFVDVRCLPADGIESYIKTNAGTEEQIARHLVHLRRNDDGLQERIRCDERQRISSIQRLYDGVTHVETTGVSLSFVSVAIAQQHLRSSDLSDLKRLRSRLVERGVPNQDIASNGTALDLTQSEDLLALNSAVTFTITRGHPRPPYTELSPGIWIGPGCKIHRASRIYSPVILHETVSIGPEAVIAGPAVLGAGASVEQRGLVSQSLVLPGARVPAGAIAVHCVTTPGGERGSQSGAWFDQSKTSFHFPPPMQPVEYKNAERTARASARNRKAETAMKRIIDLLLAFFGLLILSPLLFLVAMLIKITSHGPALFGHEREGLHGRIFRCWKFRTMVDHAHAQQRALYRQNGVDGPQFKLPNDPRITWLGRWLRVTNIDELPQLYNVLRGEMSLIGPRPSPFRENQLCVPWRNARLSVRPGITGLWQICRQDRSAGDFHQWIYFDLLYVRHWSVSLDLGIFLATLLTLGGRWSVPLTWVIPARVRGRELLDPQIHEHSWPVLRIPPAIDQEQAAGIA